MAPVVDTEKKKGGSLRRLFSPFSSGSSSNNNQDPRRSKSSSLGGWGKEKRPLVETAFVGNTSPTPHHHSVYNNVNNNIPDTSLVLEERREQLKRHDWRQGGGSHPDGRLTPVNSRSGRCSAPPQLMAPRHQVIYEEPGKKRVTFWSGTSGGPPDRPLPPLPRGKLPRSAGPWGQHGHYGVIIGEADTDSEAGSEVQRILYSNKEEWSDGKGRSNSAPDQSSGDERRSGGGRRRDDPRRHTLGGSGSSDAPPSGGQLGAGYPPAAAPQPRTAMDLESPLSAKTYMGPMNPMLMDDDPGIMSEVETSSTGFRRGNKQRSSLPVVRTPSKTLERPLGLVFLQYRGETKRALLPNEITSIDTVKALFVRSFPKQLTMEYLDSPHVKIYIHDSSKDMFYELEDVRSHLRDIRDRSVLRLFESSDVAGTTGVSTSVAPPTWDQDQSYFSEPEFDSEYQHQHIHKTKGSKGSAGGAYYMTHSFPPGGTATLGRPPLLRPYAPPPPPTAKQDGYMSSPERGVRGYPGGGYPAGGSFEDPYYAPGYGSRTGAITPVIDEEASDTEVMEETYGTGYGVRRAPGFAAAPLPPPPLTTATYDATRIRVEHMERQLASLTGLVQKALSAQVRPPPELLTVPPSPAAVVPPATYHRSHSVGDEYDKHSSSSSASLPDESYLRPDTKPPKLGRDKSVSFEKSVSFSDDPPDMSSPKQHSPQHSADSRPTKPAIKSSTLPRMSSQDRDRHKPTPPPKPVSLSPGQYEGRSVYRDLQLTAEMYNQLRGLQKKAKELRAEVRNLRRMSQTQAHTVRETIREAYMKIRAMVIAMGGEGVWGGGPRDEARLRASREGELYRQQMAKLEADLTELEGTVEELRGNVINRKTRVNMSDVENMALVLSKSSKTVAELKLRFPGLQEAIKSLIGHDMDKIVSEEKFLKDEPERLESALRRCKKLTGTLVTLKRLASVQEQRLPDSRLSPPPVATEETTPPPVTPTSGKACRSGEGNVVGGEGCEGEGGGRGGGGGGKENPLDTLLDELQAFSGSPGPGPGLAAGPGPGGPCGPGPGKGTLRRLHSYPTGGSLDRPTPPPPPPRTTSRISPQDETAANSSSRQEMLEQKHQELLRKQKQLQEQYSRLQALARTGPGELKKTGSESNLLGRMGLGLAPMTGSLSQLAPHTLSTPSSSNMSGAKIYETDIL